MAKEFNTEGKCRPDLHFMADTTAKFDAIMDLIKKGKYFIIHRPRQYGKTTMLFKLLYALNEDADYITFNTSFQGVGDDVFLDEQRFCPMFLELLEAETKEWQHPRLADFLSEAKQRVTNLKDLSKTITELVGLAGKKLVLFIDEVDKSSNNQLFVSFLAMLRDKYLRRELSSDATFYAVVLAGVYDVKSLKIKIRSDDEKKYNSPWNIAADFDVNMDLQPNEIKPMLDDYALENGVAMDTIKIAEHLFYYTSGYPFLVSKICKIIDEKMPEVRSRKAWAVEDVDHAVERLLQEHNTNFDTVVKNLENYPELYHLTAQLILESQALSYDALDPMINLGVLHGIFTKNGTSLAIHNRIYAEVIANYMTARAMRTQLPSSGYEYSGIYMLPGGHLNVEKVLLRFQNLLKEEYSQKDRDFLERQGRLIFLAFLKPILNGHGYSFKEPQISEEKRLDIVITLNRHKYVVELKLWRGEQAHKKGLIQLVDYLNRQGLDTGYLVIFDHSAVKEWKQQRVRTKGKKIFIVWV
jgi:hypothetical protein